MRKSWKINLGLIVCLLSLLGLSFMLFEWPNRQKEQQWTDLLALKDVTYKQIESGTIGEGFVFQKRNLNIALSDGRPLDPTALDRFIHLIQNLKILEAIDQEVQTQNDFGLNLNKSDFKLSFLDQKGQAQNLEFILGDRVLYNQNFYACAKRNTSSFKCFIIETPLQMAFENNKVYSEEEGGVNEVYDFFQSLKQNPEKNLLEKRILSFWANPQLVFKSQKQLNPEVEIKNSVNRSFKMLIKQNQTFPEVWEGLSYDTSKIKLWWLDFLSLKAINVLNSDNLETPIAEIDVYGTEQISGYKKLSFSLYPGYKLKTNFCNWVFQLDEKTSREVFFKNFQDFWQLHPVALIQDVKQFIKTSNTKSYIPFKLEFDTQKGPKNSIAGQFLLGQKLILGQEGLQIQGDFLSPGVFKIRYDKVEGLLALMLFSSGQKTKSVMLESEKEFLDSAVGENKKIFTLDILKHHFVFYRSKQEIFIFWNNKIRFVFDAPLMPVLENIKDYIVSI